MSDDAWRAAERAQERAGVRIRTLEDLNDQAVAVRIFDQVWVMDSGASHVESNLLRALIHSGGYLAAAFDSSSDEPVGAAFGVVGRHQTPGQPTLWHTHLHSHMAGVIDSHHNRSIGTAIKLHQRAWALSVEIDTIVWSFDPLVRRNAWLNLHKLGTEVRGYEPNFYGDMRDALNVGDPTDRVFAWWELNSPRAVAAAQETLPAVQVSGGDQVVIIPTPEDIITVRAQAPEQAKDWRMRVRQQFLDAQESELTVLGLDTEGSYVLAKKGRYDH